MARLTIVEFNSPEFWGVGGNIPGGYGFYSNVRKGSDRWHRIATGFFDLGMLKGKRVIDLGCGWGSVVRHLRDMGIDAYGIDLPFPIGKAVESWPDLEPFLFVGDVLGWAASQGDGSWDAVISRGFLECLSDEDLLSLIPQLNRIARLQIHNVDPSSDGEYYNKKTLEGWAALPFKVGTIITDEVG